LIVSVNKPILSLGENTYWSLLTCINGGLGGMVALCAGCDAFHPGAAFAVGIMGGFTMWWVSNLVRDMGVDDPLGNGLKFIISLIGDCW